MPSFSPIQTSFAGGELSPRLRGRVETPVYKTGLALCENFRPLAEGPLVMRAGSWHVATWPEAGEVPRLFELRVSGSDDDYVVAVGATKVRLYSKAGLVAFHQNLIANGSFDANVTDGGWAGSGTWDAGVLVLGGVKTHAQTIPTVAGAHYRVSFRWYSPPTGGGFTLVIDGVAIHDFEVTAYEWRSGSYDFVGDGAPMAIAFDTHVGLVCHIDDVVAYQTDGGTISEFASPWTAEQLAEVQYSSELSKGRVFFVHRNVQPRVLSMPAPGAVVVDFYTATFASTPSSWAGTNWPGVVEAGFQGRLWLASTPADPHVVWGSKSGSPFDFSLGAGTASDSLSFSITTKGRVEWMQGQRLMLVGSEAAEHQMSGSQGLITPTDVDVKDGSAFGSAPLQARHIGDQVLWVSSNRRKVRALDYSWERQSWFSRAITFPAQHIVDGDIAELHWAQNPDPLIAAVLATGQLRACSYDRAEQVAAWWRIVTAGTVGSAAMARTADGDELWQAVTRGGTVRIERIPLHEVDVAYVDAAVSLAVPAGDAPVVAGLDHLEGQAVRLLLDGALEEDQVVAGGQVTLSRAGATLVAGLAYSAKAVTLPLEGGSPAGTAQGSKRRFPKVTLRISESALPLVNGKRAADRSPTTPMDTPEALQTADVLSHILGWEDGAQLTIEQDLPFRTEVLAIFGTAKVNEV